MSFIHATNSSMPNLMGLSLLIFGGASAMSVMVGGSPILNFPGAEVADFAFGAATAFTGFFVLKEGSAVAAWLAAALVVGAMTYAGLDVNTEQATRMATATINAAKNATTNAVDGTVDTSTASTAPSTQWVAVRRLTDAEEKWCNNNPHARDTAKGRINCTKASDGNRWIWAKQ